MVARLCNMRKVLVIPIVVDALVFVTPKGRMDGN